MNSFKQFLLRFVLPLACVLVLGFSVTPLVAKETDHLLGPTGMRGSAGRLHGYSHINQPSLMSFEEAAKQGKP